MPAASTHTTIAPSPVEWWKEYPCPCPKELICHAALFDSAAINLQTVKEFDRVAEAYITHCREVKYWAHRDGAPLPYTRNTEKAYRDRLKDYRRALVWSLKQRRAV